MTITKTRSCLLKLLWAVTMQLFARNDLDFKQNAALESRKIHKRRDVYSNKYGTVIKFSTSYA